MEFTFETQYNAKTMAVMAKALRKTIRKKRSRRSHIFGWIVTVLGLLLIIIDFTFDFRTIITSIAVLAILIALLFEDQINGYLAKKQLLPGTEKAAAVFSEDGFISTKFSCCQRPYSFRSCGGAAEAADFIESV